MSKQFDSYDDLETRRELLILFQKLGGDLPEPLACEVRARWLESLIPLSVSSLAAAPLQVNPSECYPVGAYLLFVAITGVLGVPIRKAAQQLDDYVAREAWRRRL